MLLMYVVANEKQNKVTVNKYFQQFHLVSAGNEMKIMTNTFICSVGIESTITTVPGTVYRITGIFTLTVQIIATICV